MGIVIETAPIEYGGARVEQAALWLDEHYPGWAQLIDLDDFHMDDDEKCIGGQIGVSWEVLRDSYKADSGRYVNGLFASYDEEWAGEILARR